MMLGCICMLTSPVVLKADGNVGSGRKEAVKWVKEAVSHTDTEDVIQRRDYYDVMSVIRLEEEQSEPVQGGGDRDAVYNTDELCRLLWGNNDGSLLEKIHGYQGEDGGYGLTDSYLSDPYDSLLVLCAEAYHKNVCDEEDGKNIREEKTQNQSRQVVNLLEYITGKRNEDGGIGYTDRDISRPGLTAELGTAMMALGVDDEKIYKSMDVYLSGKVEEKLERDNYKEQAQIARYLLRRGLIDDRKGLEHKFAAVQEGDGSIYGDIPSTIQYILLSREIEEAGKLQLLIRDISVECDKYVLEAGEEQSISADVRISYESNQDTSVNIRCTLFEGKEVFAEKMEEQVLKNGSGEVAMKTGFSVKTPGAENSYKLVITVEQPAETEDENIVLAEKEILFTLHEDVVDDLVLDSEIKSGEECGVSLSWNDISNTDHRYGYRIFRKISGGEWETRSVWNGERVRVLNVYPCAAAKDYLVKWMKNTTTGEGEPAGKGLFEIDTVYIDDYNREPDTYLMDEHGDYQYDVLVFGTYDRNADKDLNSLSWEATKRFIDDGRGVLFGHDTVAANSIVNHPVFGRFADQLGVLLKWNASYAPTTKVSVVNQGFLTSYPWKLTGTLTVPSTHSLGQYTGGSMKAIVWMKFPRGYITDAESGAIDDAYLFSNNSLAMIQTGHSNGRATDDERKILANTMFYLKQLTHQTTAVDHSFYDETLPSEPVMEISEDNCIRISAKDYGTDYEYRVEAVGAKEDDRQISNTVSANALSGIQGFITGISDSEDSMPELLLKKEDGTYRQDILPAEKGQAIFELPELEPSEVRYIHAYALDNAGNVSKESMIRVTGKEKEPAQGYFHIGSALIALDGSVTLNCNRAEINGDIYGKEAFCFQGTSLQLDGTAASTGKVSLAGAWFDVKDKKEGAEELEIPEYIDEILADMDCGETEELAIYNSEQITVPTLCQKTTGAWCPELGIYANLISEKSISINANKACAGKDEKVVLCSKEGDITIQATNFTGKGLIYAPNGTVTINVSELKYTGTIIAKQIRLQMSNCMIDREEE